MREDVDVRWHVTVIAKGGAVDDYEKREEEMVYDTKEAAIHEAKQEIRRVCGTGVMFRVEHLANGAYVEAEDAPYGAKIVGIEKPS